VVTISALQAMPFAPVLLWVKGIDSRKHFKDRLNRLLLTPTHSTSLHFSLSTQSLRIRCKTGASLPTGLTEADEKAKKALAKGTFDNELC
jgi:hypothetical protein